MGVTKTEAFTERQNQLAAVAKAVGHPARVAIIDYMLAQPSCICKDIVDELPLSQPTVSQHLQALKNAGLIRGSIEANTVCYCLDPAGLELLRAYLAGVTQRLTNPAIDCC